MASRGLQQNGKSGIFDPDKAHRASVLLAPREPERLMYEALVAKLNVSGAEVLRTAIRDLHAKVENQAAKKETCIAS